MRVKRNTIIPCYSSLAHPSQTRSTSQSHHVDPVVDPQQRVVVDITRYQSPAASFTPRRQYIRPALRIDCPPTTPTTTPKHWDLASRVGNLDVREEDGYVLSANGEGSTSGVFVPCEPLSAIRRARRPGRLLRINSTALHRRRISGITTTSPLSPTTVSAYIFLLRTSFSLITNIHFTYLPTQSLFLT